MFILDLVSNCQNPALANLFMIAQKFITVLQILTPILALVFLGVNLIKSVQDPDNKKNFSRYKNWLLALVMVFALPVIVDTAMNLLGENYSISACWNYAEQNQSTGQGSTYNDGNDGEKESILVDPGKYSPGSSNNDQGSNSSGNNSNNGGNAGTITSGGNNGVVGTHKNSKTGIVYNLYNQSSDAWKGHYYSSGQDIARNGCMNTSTAVVSSGYDKSITPVTAFSKYRHAHPRDGITGLTKGNISCSKGSTSKSNIVNVLNDGNAVVIMVYGKSKGGSSKFTSSQHYMALIDINGNSVFIGNAYSNSGNGKYGWFNIDDVLTSIQVADYCYPSSSLKGN